MAAHADLVRRAPYVHPLIFQCRKLTPNGSGAGSILLRELHTPGKMRHDSHDPHEHAELRKTVPRQRQLSTRSSDSAQHATHPMHDAHDGQAAHAPAEGAEPHEHVAHDNHAGPNDAMFRTKFWVRSEERRV